jgi:hypothetical protein
MHCFSFFLFLFYFSYSFLVSFFQILKFKFKLKFGWEFFSKFIYNSKTSVWTGTSTYIIFFHIIIKIFLFPIFLGYFPFLNIQIRS